MPQVIERLRVTVYLRLLLKILFGVYDVLKMAVVAK